ncbi:MAG: porin family protein [Bacteroidales bacterium]
MRKHLFLLLFSIPLLGTTAFAQKPFPKEHSLGVTGGVVLSKMSFQPITIVQDYKMGPSFGITYRYIEEKYFGIQAELLYTRRGWKDRLEDYPDLFFERSMDYIELPILSHIFFGNNRFRGFVNLGPKFAYYLSDSKNTNITEKIDGVETAHHTLAVSKKFDYGITGGAGIELRFGRNSILLEGRYYFGLGDIFPNEKKDIFEASSNQNISVSATYLFHLKRKK